MAAIDAGGRVGGRPATGPRREALAREVLGTVRRAFSSSSPIELVLEPAPPVPVPAGRARVVFAEPDALARSMDGWDRPRVP